MKKLYQVALFATALLFMADASARVQYRAVGKNLGDIVKCCVSKKAYILAF